MNYVLGFTFIVSRSYNIASPLFTPLPIHVYYRYHYIHDILVKFINDFKGIILLYYITKKNSFKLKKKHNLFIISYITIY